MRYIEKNNPCHLFINYLAETKLLEYIKSFLAGNEKTHPWKKFDENKEGSEVKKKLTIHLYNEQKGLCVYCQQELNRNNKILSNYAHLEHLRPKEIYPGLSLDYLNLTVSCNGFDCMQFSTKKEFCGHKKGNEFDDDKFLNPAEVKDIEKYFVYTPNGNIKPASDLSDVEKEKAEYMINLLDLQNKILIRMRRNSYSAAIKNVNEIEKLLAPDEDHYPGFYSMLKQLFHS